MEFLKKLFLPITAPIAFIQNHFKATLLVLVVFALIGEGDPEKLEKPNLMEIKLFGPILSSEEFLKNVDLAREEHIKGVLLNVDSPGGAVAPSVEMMYAIKELAKTKPVVAYASNTIASGSYYASIGASKIVANPGSIVGSIGVIFQMTNFEKLLETAGVSFNVIKKGEYKESGNFYRQWTEKERSQLQRLADETYHMFVADVVESRGLNIKDAPKFADGQIFTSREAMNLGLIDELGTILTSKTLLVNMSGVSDPIWYKKDKFESFVERLAQEAKIAVQSTLTSSGGLSAY